MLLYILQVLYVCEGMNNSMGDAMAAHARDRSTRYQSVQQDTTLGFPYQVQRPDGEERYPSKKPHPAPDQVGSKRLEDLTPAWPSRELITLTQSFTPCHNITMILSFMPPTRTFPQHAVGCHRRAVIYSDSLCILVNYYTVSCNSNLLFANSVKMRIFIWDLFCRLWLKEACHSVKK